MTDQIEEVKEKITKTLKKVRREAHEGEKYREGNMNG